MVTAMQVIDLANEQMPILQQKTEHALSHAAGSPCHLCHSWSRFACMLCLIVNQLHLSITWKGMWVCSLY